MDWIDGFRVSAITRALAGRTDWDVAATMALQTDQHAVAWEQIRPFVLDLMTDNPAAQRALTLLRGWDGNVAAASVPAAVYELFVSEMVARIARSKAPKSFEWALGQGVSQLMDHNFFCFRRTGHFVGLLRSQPPGWFKRPWSEEMAEALAAVVRDLEAIHGPDAAGWAWGRFAYCGCGTCWAAGAFCTKSLISARYRAAAIPTRSTRRRCSRWSRRRIAKTSRRCAW